MIIVILLLLFLCIPIGIAYYRDYKDNPNEFRIEYKRVKKGLIKISIIVLIYYSVNAISPLFINRGINLNNERQKNEIPLLDKNWKKDKQSSSQYIDVWANYAITKGHFRKDTKYGIFNSKSELDYYKSILDNKTIVWSEFDYNKKTIKYYKEVPNENLTSITEKGNIKHEPHFVTIEINQSEFEKHIK